MVSAWKECLPSLRIQIAGNGQEIMSDRVTRHAVRKSVTSSVTTAIKIEVPEPQLPKRSNQSRRTRPVIKLEIPPKRLPRNKNLHQSYKQNPNSIVRIKVRRQSGNSASASIYVSESNECSARLATKIIRSAKSKIALQLVPDAPQHLAPVVTIQIKRKLKIKTEKNYLN